jgi:ABC-type multidrug transport system ATPase subunit
MGVPPAAAIPANAGLRIRGVGVRIGSANLLTGITATLKPGMLCALIGPSGAGKSTLIKVLLGIKKPAAGTVLLDGAAVGAGGPVGYVPQDDALHGALKVEDALSYSAQLRLPDQPEADRRKRVDEVLGQVGLKDRRTLRIARLSGGQRKRVSVALELLTSPPLLILDEPTSGLDPGMEAHMMSLFREVALGGRVVMVSTHAMESLATCHQLIVLVEGYLAYAGPPSEAPAYFHVDRPAGIFTALKKQRGPAWAALWERSAGKVAA